MLFERDRVLTGTYGVLVVESGVEIDVCLQYHLLSVFFRDPDVGRAAAGSNPSVGTTGSTLHQRV